MDKAPMYGCTSHPSPLSTPQRSRSCRLAGLIILLAAVGVLAGLVFAPIASAATGDFIIKGKGNGHGEGMSQWGAWEAARLGNTYQQILAFYYPGTTLGALRSVSPSRETITVRITTAVDTFASVTLTAAATSAKLVDSTGATISSLAVGGSVTLVYSGSKVQVSGSTATYTYVDLKPDDATGRVTVTPSTMWSSGKPRSYWGYIRILPDTTAGQVYVQNTLAMDKYVAGVSEISGDWTISTSTSTYAPEAVKVQDVAARTYIANHTGSIPYDDSRDLNYVGYNVEASYPYLTTAAQETADIVVLTSAGKLAVTHFSDSSGGYTTNSAWSDTGAPSYEPAMRDAWSAAAPTNNPGWVWTVTMSPATLASKLAGSVSVGTITDVQVVTRDTSDADSHARTIRVTGTSGTATITARSFQSLVGLRSTLITGVTKDGGNGTTRYDHTNGNILKTGTWANFTTTSAYGGSYGRSSTSGATATIYFKGTRLDWIGMKGTTTGIADVYLDGALKTTIDLAASKATYQVGLWSTGDLTSGYHVVKIVRNSASKSGKFITLDAVDIAGTISPSPVERDYDHTNTNIVKTGTWANFTTTSAYGGSYGRSSTSGATATIYFTGSRFDWVGMKGTTTGIADVYLDGVLQKTIDLAASKATYKVNLWSSGTLTYGDHSVKIVRNSGSKSGKFITLDEIKIWGAIKAGS